MPRATHAASARRLQAAVLALTIGAAVAAPSLEDHSLPRSAVKTFQVTCDGGRLATIRFDTRQEPVRLCTLFPDDTKKPQDCVLVERAKVEAVLRDKALEACAP